MSDGPCKLRDRGISGQSILTVRATRHGETKEALEGKTVERKLATARRPVDAIS